MKVPESFDPGENFTDGGQEEFLRWIAPDAEVKYYPEFFREELTHPCEGVKHFITDGR